jgi:hypothetical protein
MATSRQESTPPFGSEFSPSQVDLPHLLEIVEASQGDPRVLEKDILAAYFTKHGRGEGDGAEYNRGKLANNCKLAFTREAHHAMTLKKLAMESAS